MNREEYYALQRVEREHWFYTGKRELVRHWLRKALPAPAAGEILLDAGAGTGELVRELRAVYDSGGVQVLGVEYAEEGREIARETNGIELIEGSILELPFSNNLAAATFALDVLEHVERDDIALGELLRVTHPGGIVIINVPALPSLWSDWDVVLRHFRRYTMRSFRALLGTAGASYETVYLGYTNFFALPPIYLYRALRRFFPSDSRAEDKVPGPLLNRLLRALYVTPAKMGWLRPPAGVSIFCVLRKR